MKFKLIFIILIFISSNSLAQEEVVFKIKLKPNTTYKTELKSKGHNIINLKSAADISSQETENNPFPMNMEVESKMVTSIITQDFDKTRNLAAIMRYDKVESKVIANGEQTIQDNPYAGMEIFGKYDKDYQFKTDSITGDQVSKQMEHMITTTLDQAQHAIKFPEKPLRVGDSFSNNIPMTIPIEGMNPIVIDMTVDFLLTGIKDNLAYFNNQYSISFSTAQDGINLWASGQGEGKSVYSIKENYLIQNTSELPMHVNVDIGEGKAITMDILTISEQNVSIE